jgi:hypothetical protein
MLNVTFKEEKEDEARLVDSTDSCRPRIPHRRLQLTCPYPDYRPNGRSCHQGSLFVERSRVQCSGLIGSFLGPRKFRRCSSDQSLFGF